MFKTNMDILSKSKKPLYLFIKYKKQNKTLSFDPYDWKKLNLMCNLLKINI